MGRRERQLDESVQVVYRLSSSPASDHGILAWRQTGADNA